MIATWNYPTRVRFGVGASTLVGEEAAALGLKRVLIVADPGVAGAGLLEAVEQSLHASGLETARFVGVDSNPTEANVEAGLRAFRAVSAQLLVAVGGGSPLDCAKLIGVRSRTDLPFEILDDAKGGDRLIPRDLPPVLAIPTTAGTGSEVGRSAVVTVASTHRKTVIFAPWMMPRVALLDPNLSVTMPPRITAATGFDAFTHCLEALVAVGDHPLADGIAMRGIELTHGSLLTAVRNGQDLEARGAMLKAAMMGATAFQKGLGACHSMAHPLSSEFNLHHGLANALCLPAVIAFNTQAAPAAYSYERVARVYGGTQAADLPALITEFRRELGLPASLSEVGIPEDAIESLAQLAFEDACHTSNPIVCSVDVFKDLYRRSFG